MNRRARVVIAVALAVSAAVAFAGCGGGDSDDTEPTDGDSISVSGKEFAFDPSELTAPADVAFTIEFANEGTIEHDFTIDALTTKILVKAGETGEAELTGLAAGTYDFYCSIPGHKEAGMVGTMEVK